MSRARDPKQMNESTTQLVTKACDVCRRKKIRCEPTFAGCLQCSKYKTQCHFTPIVVKRRPRRPIGDKQRVEELEKRLEWSENQLKQAAEEKRQSTAAETRRENKDQQAAWSTWSQIESVPLNQNIPGEVSLYSDLTLAKEPGTIFNIDNPPQKRFISAPENQLAVSFGTTMSASEVFTRPGFKALPPKEETLKLIAESFQGFNSPFPLFDQAAFMHRFESTEPNTNDPSWWACLNIVLALTHRFRDSTSPDKDEVHDAWGYLQNALAVVNLLTTMQSTLLSVQALLGMAIVLQGSSHQGPVSVLTASAIKLAQRLGMNRDWYPPGLSVAEIEQRKRVFWLAYCLDKDISLQTGQPPTQNEDDMDMEVPSKIDGTPFGPDDPKSVDFFNSRIRLALIQGQIYKRLCSVKAAKQSGNERVRAAKELQVALQTWKSGVPIDFEDGYRATTLQWGCSDPNLHPVTVILKLTFFNSLATIYSSLPTFPRYREIYGTEDPAEYLMSASIIHVAEARTVIKLLQVTPKRHYACIWAVLHIFVSATTLLLNHNISHPSNPFAVADLELIEPLLKLLSVLASTGKNVEVREMNRSCKDMFRKANTAVETFNQQRFSQPHVTIAKSGTKESVDEFLRRVERISSGCDENSDCNPGESSQGLIFENHVLGCF